MNRVKRVNIYVDFHIEVIDWAYERWKMYDDRAPNNQPLYKSFPASLEEYIKHLKEK